MIQYTNRIVLGFKTFFRGFSIIHQNKLWKFTILPCFITLLIGGLLIYTIFQVSSTYLEMGLIYIFNYFGSQLSENEIHISMKMTIKIITFIFSVICYVLLYRPISTISVIPFMGPLLSQLEKIYIGKEVEISIGKDIVNGFIGFVFALRDTVLGLLAMLLGLFLGPFQIIFIALVEGYLLGRGSFDYIFEKRANTLEERKTLSKEYRPEILGLGLAYFCFLFLPVLGVIFSPVVALAATTHLYYQKD